ncbi:MAG: hypothetical protein ACRES4_03250 [Nevskiales bacterium]
MKRAAILCILATTTLLSQAALSEEPAGETGLLKRAATVDKPIPETYEPLNSTYVGDGEKLNENIEQSWELKKRAREREEAATAAANSAERQALEKRIQEPGTGPAPASEPQVVDSGKSLEIRAE